MNKRYILVTSALPYANGHLHLGHILEFIQADIWVRYHKLIGNNCIYISGIDAHGTPIMLKSREKNIDPQDLVDYYYNSHKNDIKCFFIDIDNYYTTHSIENIDLLISIFNKLVNSGFIYKKDILQFYDSINNFFLPDRYVRGTCPKCNYPDQYGDVCENCCSKYDSIELINPISVLSNIKPDIKSSKHYFFNLKYFEPFLKDWCKKNISQLEVFNKLNEWFLSGLNDWDISRDAPYFGIKIPDENDKYFYVWLDAPIGYIASFKNYCKNNNINFDFFWDKNSNSELYHFIGKDIIYFHGLFWPAILSGSEIRLPNDIFVHGFLVINNKKMSKSNGTFITAKKYLDHFDHEFLRYYYASKLNNSITDLDFNLDEFMYKINSDFIGKFLNILSRSLNIINNYFNSFLFSSINDIYMFNHFLSFKDDIKFFYEKRLYNKVIICVMKLADEINIYIDKNKPWLLLNNDCDREKVHEICTYSINLFIILTCYLKPILPNFSCEVEKMLNLNIDNIDFINTPFLSKKVNLFKHLKSRINKSSLEKILD